MFVFIWEMRPVQISPSSNVFDGDLQKHFDTQVKIEMAFSIYHECSLP